MKRLMLIQCSDCGCNYALYLGDTVEQSTSKANLFVKEGWRFSPNRKGYICPDCRKGTSDPYYKDGFYQMYVGKAKYSNKTNTYKRILQDVEQYLMFE